MRKVFLVSVLLVCLVGALVRLYQWKSFLAERDHDESEAREQDRQISEFQRRQAIIEEANRKMHEELELARLRLRLEQSRH